MTALPDSRQTATKEMIAAQLAAARKRTLALCDLSEDVQCRSVSPLMSPLVWDLAHIGNYEEQWLLRAVDDRAAVDPTYDDLYDAFEHPRATRPSLPLLGPDGARKYIAGVREEVLGLLEGVDPDSDDHLRFLYRMVIQHEHQHDETMLATRQLMGEDARPPPASTTAPRRGHLGDAEVLVAGADVVVGTSDDEWAHDNERDAHRVALEPFWIDIAPSTNRAWVAFIDDGGYDDARLWSVDGWAWRQEAGLVAPEFWQRDGAGGWQLQRFGAWLPVPLDEPVQHVCWYEADAFARWSDKRLPSELEWEVAASWRPDAPKRRFPWGDAPARERANLGQRHDGPAVVGAYLDGLSPWGCHQMLGDVWEWTSSDFAPYPGFRSFPYPEYSEGFWGSECKGLRGGSWATDAVVARNTSRNWDLPIRRQIFAGVRCARNVA